jgi:hypothetical protein
VEKTQVVHLDQGCDFLSFNIRRYRVKLLIKPSADAIKRIRGRLRTEVRALYGANAAAVTKILPSIIRGWAAYHRIVVASKAFSALDDYLWRLLYKWAKHTHATKPKHWVTRPVLRPVQHGQRGPLGIRRPGNRNLCPQVLLDKDRPTRHGERRSISG